ncbi:beta-lactamase [Xylariales sp. AK1849]|nr:beta-lactamase [Xylariales sp. AK1849]
MRDMAFFDELTRLFSHQKDPPIDPSEFLASLGAPSISIAVLDHGDIEARCYSTIKDDVDTRFQAASISKPVTVMAVMKLVDQGRLKLEDKIADYLPQIIVDNLGLPALVQEVTIEHVLSHTAGLTTSGFEGYDSDQHPNAVDVILGRHPVNSMPVQVVGVPGRQWSYSGGGFTLLQIALEKITFQRFPKLMDELVLRPLEMTSSNYGTPETETQLATPYWNGVTPSSHWHYFPELAAAGLWTTPSDLCKVLHAVQKSLKGGEDTFLKMDTAKRMLTEIESNVMGLGWVSPKSPGTYFGHGGANDPGYRCYAMGIANLTGEDEEFPNEEYGIVVMTNGYYGASPGLTAVQTINYLKHWPEGATTSQGMPFVTPLKSLGSEIRGDWKEWEGSWSGESDEWTIEAGVDRQPQARWRQRQPVNLLPAAICPQSYEEGQSLHLLLEGTNAMMRLARRGGKRSVDYMDGLTFEITELLRAES